MKRGEIYYIANPNRIGSEIRKARPGIVVSADHLNESSAVVEVVFLTSQPKREETTHVVIRSTGRESTALCEQINTVAKQRVGNYLGACTPKEMAAIDEALLCSLGVSQLVQERDRGEKWLMQELGRIKTERDRYAKMIDTLLEVVEA